MDEPRVEATVRKPVDPREGMQCCVCHRPLFRVEWPQHPDDKGVCDDCLNGDVAA